MFKFKKQAKSKDRLFDYMRNQNKENLEDFILILK